MIKKKKKRCCCLIRIEKGFFSFFLSQHVGAFCLKMRLPYHVCECLHQSTLLVKFIKIGVQQLFIITVAFSVSYWLCLKYQIYKRNNLKNINKTSISHFKKEKKYISTLQYVLMPSIELYFYSCCCRPITNIKKKLN